MPGDQKLSLEIGYSAIAARHTGLRTRYPDETEEQIDRRVREWLIADD